MAQSQPLQNWAKNYEFSALRVHRPQTVEEIQELVLSCTKLRVLGTGHSFNGIADCDEDLIILEKMNQILCIDQERSTVTIEAGVKYGDLACYLHGRGYGLHNLASLPHTTVAGAVATATHGSGDRNGCLATIVTGLQIVDGRGQVVDLTREKNKSEFEGAVVSLGGLGVVTRLTLDLVPTYDIQQDVYQKIKFEVVKEKFDEIFSAGYSVSLFHDWTTSIVNQMWVKSKVVEGVPAAAEKFGGTLAKTDLHPIDGLSGINCTQQMGVPGAWHDRLPHFKMHFTPSSGEELQAEFLVPRHNAVAALERVDNLREHIAPVLQICEVRTIAADNLWMSPFYKEDCVAIHFTLIKDWPAVKKVLPLVDEALGPFQVRPHWAKLSTMSPDFVKSIYPKLSEFRQLLKSYDPEGKFRNRFLDTYIFADE